MSAIKRIQEIEQEIIEAANLKALLESNLKEAISETGINIFSSQLAFVEKRIARAQAEIKAIETAHFAEIQIARRNAKYPPIPPARKTFIAFADGLGLALAAANRG